MFDAVDSDGSGDLSTSEVVPGLGL